MFDGAIDLDLGNALDAPEMDGDYPIIPIGTYETQVDKVELAESKQPKAGTSGKYLNVQKRIQGPTHANRVVFQTVSIPIGKNDPRWASLTEEQKEKEAKKARMLADFLENLTGQDWTNTPRKLNLKDLVGLRDRSVIYHDSYDAVDEETGAPIKKISEKVKKNLKWQSVAAAPGSSAGGPPVY